MTSVGNTGAGLIPCLLWWSSRGRTYDSGDLMRYVTPQTVRHSNRGIYSKRSAIQYQMIIKNTEIGLPVLLISRWALVARATNGRLDAAKSTDGNVDEGNHETKYDPKAENKRRGQDPVGDGREWG